MIGCMKHPLAAVAIGLPLTVLLIGCSLPRPANTELTHLEAKAEARALELAAAEFFPDENVERSSRTSGATSTTVFTITTATTSETFRAISGWAKPDP